MASAPKSVPFVPDLEGISEEVLKGEAFHPEPAGETVELIDIEQIKVADRLRPVSEAHVHLLMGDIYAQGLLTRIEVCREGKGYRLVCGAHRLAACVRLGWTEIAARIVDHTLIVRRAREIGENLVRHELSPLDRAAHVGEWYQLQLQAKGVSLGEHKQKIAAMARWADRVKAEATDAGEMISSAYDLQDQIAEKLGLTTRTIKNDIALFRGLEPEMAEALRHTPIGSKTSQLLRLVKLPKGDRAKVVKAIVAGAATVADAEAVAGIHGAAAVKKPSEESESAKRMKRMRAWWPTLAPKERGELLDLFALDAGGAKPLARLPKGYAITTPTQKGEG
ncbi:hypothetical protein sos41_31660 [Alphaproteobacteria bacterium SO-S41]|nr:hypothetical protein sos41_31660 [Alphaproteobacteria bacterium SO-S41]